jgi:DNA helicase II / ATP-dependent DNA helicase PcrA
MRRLDPAQAAAAMCAAPIQLTLAGPGSGKTSTLTGRFVHLMRQGIDPTRILAVTFTKKAADEMRGRIARILELPSATGLNIMTFHAFAFRLLRRNPGAAGLSEGFQLWDTPEQRRVFTTRRMWWNEEQDILEIIGGAKERLLDAAAFKAAINPDDDLLIEAVRYFQVYEQAISAAGAIDFADMVPLVVKAMTTNASYRDAITGAYDHLLVDEYQDVNPGQIMLIDHFVNDCVGLWAVGDDDQTLYSFRASDIRHILEFMTRYPAATTHVLDRNYRSVSEIVAAAKRLVRCNRARIDKDYQPVVATSGELVIRGYPSPDMEARQVAGAIAKLIERGSAVESLAILYRTAAVGLPFQSILKDLGIAFEVRGGADLWHSVAVRLVVGSLTYLRDGDSPEAMSRLGSNKRAEIVCGQLDQIRAAVRGHFLAAATHVRRIISDAAPARTSERERAEWHAVVGAVIALANSCSSLEQLEDRITEQSQSLRNPPANAVVLSTIHSAKGLEWDTVFLVGMEDGILPHGNCEDIEEERRVAYVGMTRARRRLGLTYSAERYGEKARPSPFLFEIGGKEQRQCIWTGPRSNGANERLPLMTESEKRRLIRIAET